MKSKHDLTGNLISGDKIIIQDEEAVVSSIRGRKKISLGIPIRINSATVSDLAAIPGIGPELASRIVSYRESNGNIYSIDELNIVKGIGEKKLAELKKYCSSD